jgi:hypothetical protein
MGKAFVTPLIDQDESVPYFHRALLLGALFLEPVWAAAPAASGVDAASGIEACTHISDNQERLACFDREAALQKEKQQSNAPATEAAQPAMPASAGQPAVTAPRAQPPVAGTVAQPPAGALAGQPTGTAAGSQPAQTLTPEQAMGLTPGRILKLEEGATRGRSLKELNAKIQGVSTNASGRAVFTLDNGQVWRQVEPDPNFTVQPGDTVHITKGVLGSFFMSAGSHRNTRVSRAR